VQQNQPPGLSVQKDTYIETGRNNSGTDCEEEDKIFLHMIHQLNSRDETFITLDLNNQTPVWFKLDTGVQANILPTKYFDTIKPPLEIKPTAQRLTTVDQESQSEENVRWQAPISPELYWNYNSM
jgi:hypothetical protein